MATTKKATTTKKTKSPTEKKQELKQQLIPNIPKGMMMPPPLPPPCVFTEVKNDEGRLVGIKTSLPFPLQNLRVERYNVSLCQNEAVYYIFDERGNTYFVEKNEEYIMTVLKRIAPQIQQ